MTLYVIWTFMQSLEDGGRSREACAQVEFYTRRERCKRKSQAGDRELFILVEDLPDNPLRPVCFRDADGAQGDESYHPIAAWCCTSYIATGVVVGL